MYKHSVDIKKNGLNHWLGFVHLTRVMGLVEKCASVGDTPSQD